MSQLADQLHHVVEKTARLIDLCAALQEENDLLKLENESLKVTVDAGKNKSAELEEKLRIVTMARSLEGINPTDLGGNEKSLDIKQKISEFVREIDKCIVLLKK
jgi:regulator of replication initiation timing